MKTPQGAGGNRYLRYLQVPELLFRGTEVTPFLLPPKIKYIFPAHAIGGNGGNSSIPSRKKKTVDLDTCIFS